MHGRKHAIDPEFDAPVPGGVPPPHHQVATGAQIRRQGIGRHAAEWDSTGPETLHHVLVCRKDTYELAIAFVLAQRARWILEHEGAEEDGKRYKSAPATAMPARHSVGGNDEEERQADKPKEYDGDVHLRIPLVLPVSRLS